MSDNDPTPPPPDDRELEDFLSRKGPLSQAYRAALPPERVPDNIDAAVKAWARREHDQHLGKRGRWWDRAALPLGAAASLILVALLVNKGRESGVSEREALREATAGAVASAERSVAAPVAATARPQAAAPAVTAAPPPVRSRDTLGKADDVRGRPQAAPSPPPQPVTALASSPPTEPAPAAPLPASPPASAAADASLASNQPAAMLEDRASVAAEQKMEDAPAQRMAGVMSSAGNLAMKSAGAAATAPASPPRMSAPAPAPLPAAPAAMKVASPPVVADEGQLQRCEGAAPGSVPDATRYPAAAPWLNGIRSLRDAHQVDTAERQLHCWQRVYPQSAVPEDLAALLNPR